MLIELIRQAYKDKQVASQQVSTVVIADKTKTDPKVIQELRERGYHVDTTDEPKLTAADRSQI